MISMLRFGFGTDTLAGVQRCYNQMQENTDSHHRLLLAHPPLSIVTACLPTPRRPPRCTTQFQPNHTTPTPLPYLAPIAADPKPTHITSNIHTTPITAAPSLAHPPRLSVYSCHLLAHLRHHQNPAHPQHRCPNQSLVPAITSRHDK